MVSETLPSIVWDTEKLIYEKKIINWKICDLPFKVEITKNTFDKKINLALFHNMLNYLLQWFCIFFYILSIDKFFYFLLY